MADVLTIGSNPPAVKEEVAPPGTEGSSNGKLTTATATTPEAPKVEEKKEARPSWLPEKFKTAEDFAKSYSELEAKLGKPAEEKKVETPATTPEAQQKAIADAGIDMAALTKEYAENNGALKPETITNLKAKGLSEATINTYIEGQKAVATAYTNELAQKVGGIEEMTKIFDWAKVNLSPDEITSFNDTMTSFNKPLATLALEGLAARYTAAMGTNPSFVKGEAVPSSAGAKPYGSTQEIQRAMSDPKYKSGDRAYHAEVAARMAVTDMFALR